VRKPVIVEPEAEADIDEAYEWYDDRRPGLGEDFLLCIEAALEAIGERPKSFPVIHAQTRRTLVRRFPYLVLFVEMPAVITVVGVFHTSRNPKTWTPRLR
jgi:plasmid stabilization system protein ParE